MEDAASTLLGFPLAAPFPSDELYDEAVKLHIKKIEQLLSKKKDAVTGENSIQLLKV